MLLLIGPPNQADPAGLWLLRTKWYRRWAVHANPQKKTWNQTLIAANVTAQGFPPLVRYRRTVEVNQYAMNLAGDVCIAFLYWLLA